MRKTNLIAGLLCLSLASACGGRNETEDGEDLKARHGLPPASESASGNPQAITATGCLTQAGDRYVLTELRSAEQGGAATTETYQLVNLEDQLRQHVGKQVRVYGQADPPQSAEVRSLEPAATTGQAQVDTESRTRLETRTLRISTVAATGGACGA